MASPKTAIEVPADNKIADENGKITLPWLQFFGLLAQAVGKLREGSELMDDLTPGVTTLTEITTAWEELRSKLQEIA